MRLPRTATLLLAVSLAASFSPCAIAQNESEHKTTDEGRRDTFFGQDPPGATAERFAPEALTHEPHDGPVISLDEKWLLFQGMEVDLLFYAMVDGNLTPVDDPLGIDFPEVCNGVAMSPSGDRLYIEEWAGGRNRLYYIDRDGECWTEPTYVDLGTSSSLWQISIASNGNLYFGSDGIQVSTWRAGSHGDPVPLRLEDGTSMPGDSPFIAPDESYIIHSIGGNLNISYRRDDGTWIEPIDLGPDINSDQMELCPQITPGGEYLVFVSRRDFPLFGVFWADAGFVDRLRPEGLE